MNVADTGLAQRAEKLGLLLADRGATICTAESCTGGWIAKTFTDVSGSSAWFGFGLVTYSNAAKKKLLDVAPGTIARHGAVSEQVVAEMATGALALAQADLAVSVSGVAGPDGGTRQKPVGTVWFGIACGGVLAQLNPEVRTECCHFAGDRQAVRRATVAHAIDMLLNTLSMV